MIHCEYCKNKARYKITSNKVGTSIYECESDYLKDKAEFKRNYDQVIILSKDKANTITTKLTKKAKIKLDKKTIPNDDIRSLNERMKGLFKNYNSDKR